MAQIGSLKVVELTKQVDNLNDVPYLNFGQEIQAKRPLIRYYQIVGQLLDKKAQLAKGEGMPLPQSSYVNLLIDDPELDFYRPKFITYPKSGAKVNRFGSDLDQLKLDIENEFAGLIRRIRADLKIDGSNASIPVSKLGIGGPAGLMIALDPRQVELFLLGVAQAINAEAELKTQVVNGKTVNAYDVDLSYFSA